MVIEAHSAPTSPNFASAILSPQILCNRIFMSQTLRDGRARVKAVAPRPSVKDLVNPRFWCDLFKVNPALGMGCERINMHGPCGKGRFRPIDNGQ